MAESMCIRIKRKNQTFFIRTSKASSISSIKNEISDALSCSSNNENVIPEKMRLYLSMDPSSALRDVSTIADHNSIKDNSELYLVFSKGGDAWESIDVEALSD